MKERKTFYMSKTLAEKLRSVSFYERISQSEIVERAIIKYVKQLKTKDNNDE